MRVTITMMTLVALATAACSGTGGRRLRGDASEGDAAASGADVTSGTEGTSGTDATSAADGTNGTAGTSGTDGTSATDGTGCVPMCGLKTCGDNGCGGTCGTCAVKILRGEVSPPHLGETLRGSVVVNA